ncbi:uncharacterized protein LOC132311380 isoform X1 [Cornus florida]|uniref:uncharacterized protein LOC132311380 isoform X1 n=1 Tax=Cornus florida TaxID=4283 RepID=UPI00289DDA12|nr:uncharacterized protein LOC132311380 isoform X1 [Cornus florida]XP_059665263.1 uncharacterized protein LOC132311380 isoform X1 [Cornus florida]XP_059665264.1 uncharacterized protein LOC132311380 isoform X1 [Cornus florida]
MEPGMNKTKKATLNIHKAASSDGDGKKKFAGLANKPIGPVDPVKCAAYGAGVVGGTAGTPSDFMIMTMDSDEKQVQGGGAELKVLISPTPGVGGSSQAGTVDTTVHDMKDGTYRVFYEAPKMGEYELRVWCNGTQIADCPFPMHFSPVKQTKPSMPNCSSVWGVLPGLVEMIPGIIPGSLGGVYLPGVGASLGQLCQEHLNGRCSKTVCEYNHPAHDLLLAALATTTSSQVPMVPSPGEMLPSPGVMAAAQSIVAAEALQAYADAQAQAQSARVSSGSADKEAEILKRTLRVSHFNPLFTVDMLKGHFSLCGKVVECSITDSKKFAYIEYSTAEEANAAFTWNKRAVEDKLYEVEMAKSLPHKPALLSSSNSQFSLCKLMEKIKDMQWVRFKQAADMPETMTPQQAADQAIMTARQAADQAATMKTAKEVAVARAAEISKKLKADGFGNSDEETNRKSRDIRDDGGRGRRRDLGRSHDHHSSVSRRNRSRSTSPRTRKSYRGDSDSPKHRRESSTHRTRKSHDHHSSVSRRNRSRSTSPRTRKSYRGDSDSPKHRRESSTHRTRKPPRASSKSPGHRGSRPSSRSDDLIKSKHTRRSRSKSAEVKHQSGDKLDDSREERSQHPREDGRVQYQRKVSVTGIRLSPRY